MRALLLSLLAIVYLHAVSAGDPTCSRGIKSTNNPVCCPKYCVSCDQGDCASRPGGYWNCCNLGIRQKNQYCSSSESPCVMSSPQQQQQAGGGAVQRTTSISIMAGNPEKDVWSRINRYNVYVDTMLIYQNVGYLSWDYLKQCLNTGLQVTLVLEFRENYGNLWDIANGKYDSKLRDFFNKVRQDGRRVTVRALHEFNGNWYNWCIHDNGSNSVEAYKAAFRRISGVVRATGANVKIQASYNSLSSNNDNTPLQNMYVGDAFVDEICVSAYNFCGLHVWQNQNIHQLIDKWYYSMLSVTSKPLCIAEMSSTNKCNNAKGQWLYDTWQTLATDFTRIRTVTWFLSNNWALGEDLDLNTLYEIDQFRNGANRFKQLTGYAQHDAVDVKDPAAEKVKHELALEAEEQYQAELAKRGLVAGKESGVPSAHAFNNTRSSAPVKSNPASSQQKDDKGPELDGNFV